MNEPNYEQLLADIIEVAKEQPDKIFPKDTADPAAMGCIYVNDDGSPCCIVGQAWARQEPLNVAWFATQTIGKWATGPRNTQQFTKLVEDFGTEITATVDTIRSIQRWQDEGVSWGDAVKKVIGE